MTYTITRITSHKPDTLTKEYQLTDNGDLKKHTAAQMISGRAKQLNFKSAAELKTILQSLSHNQALCFGTLPADSMDILSTKEYEQSGKPAGVATRTKDFFKWPASGGVLMLDYDPQEGQPALSKDELLDALINAVPEIAQSAYVWWCSSSSLIYNGDEQLTGIKGQRVYILVKDAKDIERAGAVIAARLWLKGHGRYDISRAGALLERTLIDASVWQSNRLDFAAGSQCVPPLEQRRGDPVVHEGGALDTAAALPDLNPEQNAKLKTIKQQIRKGLENDVKAAKAEYRAKTIDERISDLGRKPTDEEIRQIESTINKALSNSVLTDDFVIILSDRKKVTVGEVLDKPAEYHGALTLDPLEPEYHDFKAVGKLYLIGGRANLHSFAHGKKNYRLIRHPKNIEHIKGSTYGTTTQTLQYMRLLPDVFDMGTELVQINNGRIERLNNHSLSFWLGGVAQYWRYKKQDEIENIDPPMQVVNQILSIQRNLNPLKALISAPVITSKGRVLNVAGYDEETQLYLDMSEAPPEVPASVSEPDALKALERVMEPFNEFSVASSLDRAVLLAAIITAVLRPVLPSAPAFGLDAPTQGTGKTYLAKCLGLLATGNDPAVYPHTAGRDDEEVRKRLMAILAAGDLVIIWDNVLGQFDSASIASFLTSDTYNDRILGKTETSSIPNRALLLITGNNLTLAGDMPRRVLKCRLDAKIENPAIRKFNMNPLKHIKQYRQEIVKDVLTLVRGYQQSTTYKNGGAVKDENTASFEEWDALVRQTCAWVAQLKPDRYTDPAEALKEAVNNDPEREELGSLLDGIFKIFGHRQFTARELMKHIPGEYTHDAGVTVEEILNTYCTGVLNARSVGRILTYRQGRRVNGKNIIVKKRGNVNLFQIENNETLV